eukprot:4042008-Amphidinium_carterae.1
MTIGWLLFVAIQSYSRPAGCRHPFDDAEQALEQINAVAGGTSTEVLTNFLEMNLPKQMSQLIHIAMYPHGTLVDSSRLVHAKQRIISEQEVEQTK